MNEVKRYKLLQSVCYDDGAFVIPAGQVMVTASAHDDVVQALRAENARLRGLLAEIQFDCEHIGGIQHLDKAERRTWVSVANRIKDALQPERGTRQ